MEMGELAFDADAVFRSAAGADDTATDEAFRALDVAVFEHLKEAIRPEMDCQLCYHLLLDPLTTACGHTFCRTCLRRVLDHSYPCPTCRRSLDLSLSNCRLTDLLTALFPDSLAARAEAVAREEAAGGSGRLATPLFVCGLAFPATPTFLHVFEPRYRLMMRRVVEGGRRTFGMVMYNRACEPQGQLGVTPFVEYGTMLYVVNMKVLPDGRSLVESVGISRFRVQAWGMRDGYVVADVARVDDVPVDEEEHVEAAETSQPPAAPHDLLAQLDRLPTRALLQIGADFVDRMRARSAPWLHQSVLETYGDAPADPALFPYWFASILPIADEEKYQLLSITSVRKRLKLTARWVKRIEAQRW
jgi:Lon protease-like protein